MLTSLLEDKFIEIRTSRCLLKKKHLNPQSDSQVLLFLGMSEESAILLEEISLSQAYTESTVGAAGFDIAVSQHPPSVPAEKFVVARGERVRVEFWNNLFLEIVA